MAPEHKGSDGGNLEMSKRSQKLLHWSEKVKILNKERKKKDMLKLVRYAVRKNILWSCEEGEIKFASLAVTFQTEKVAAVVYKCFKMKKALNLQRPHSQDFYYTLLL